MANWLTVLSLKDVYEEKPISELAGIIADRLERIQLPLGTTEWDRDTREELVSDFRSLASDPSSNAEDFDEIMSSLYNWADTSMDGKFNGKKLCWVETI